MNLRIIDKEFKLIPFELKPVQKRLADYVIYCLATEQPIRVIVCKARQQGISTVIEALIYWWSSTHENVPATIVSHEQKSSDHLFGMYRTFYEHSNKLFKPETKYDTRTSISFEKLNSRIAVATARNLSTGRSQTISWLHASEVAYWPRGEELLAGMMQAVPLKPNTAIFIESTANGIGDFFHRLWVDAKAGDSPFKPFFFGWFEDPDYKLPHPDQMHLSEKESEIRKLYKLNLDQMAWYRYKALENKATPGKMEQEYPSNDSEAFLASGRPRFHMPTLVQMEQTCQDAKQYELIRTGNTIEAKEIELKPLKIWDMPEDNEQYVIGADVAEGIEQDYSVATVIRKRDMKVVARWRGDAEPFEFGEILYTLGKFYKDALIGCEINNHGLTTVQRLRDMHYTNLYRREKGLDERFEEFTSRLGWRTDATTKPMIIDSLAEALVGKRLIDLDINFIRECMSYIVGPRGRTEAQTGSHDDTVMATAIALQLFDWNPAVQFKTKLKQAIPKRYKAYSATRERLKGLVKR